MLSYRHAFHAGNHADVFKHFILYLVLSYYNIKDKPYWYIDTHSGAGVYHLLDTYAQKVGEYQQGVARLFSTPIQSPILQGFVAHLQGLLPEHFYAGSPWLAHSLLRMGDKLRLFELHPSDFALLQEQLAVAIRKRRCILRQEDGFQGLIRLLPPPTRRAVVLIDPPYEQKQDYVRVIQTLKDALQRFAQGCYLLWYPCLSREESKMLPEKLLLLQPNNYVHAQLCVHTPRPDGLGMFGSGMWIINPPYLLAQQLQQTLPELTHLLAQDKGAYYTLTHRIA